MQVPPEAQGHVAERLTNSPVHPLSLRQHLSLSMRREADPRLVSTPATQAPTGGWRINCKIYSSPQASLPPFLLLGCQLEQSKMAHGKPAFLSLATPGPAALGHQDLSTHPRTRSQPRTLCKAPASLGSRESFGIALRCHQNRVKMVFSGETWKPRAKHLTHVAQPKNRAAVCRFTTGHPCKL